jgi:2-dehydrotetronate isomerase
MLYPEASFLDRFAMAAADGFKAVEFLFPYLHPAREINARLQDNGLRQVLFNSPPGLWDSGERGLACLPTRKVDFRASVERALEYAVALQCPNIHVMAGLVPEDADASRLRDTYVQNLAWAAHSAGKVGVSVMIEPINTRDIPRYFLKRQTIAHTIVQAIAAPNLKVQMDLYHVQIAEGDVATKLKEFLPTGRVGHMQIAGVPERHEPDVGEINYPYLFELIDSLDYKGWIGCEYRPALGNMPGGTRTGLKWLTNRKSAAK